MNAIRSVVFNIFFFTGSFALSLLLLWTVFLPQQKCLRITGTAYLNYMLWICKYIMGIRLEIRGREHMPVDGNFVIAAKHQSAFETLTLPFMRDLGFPAIVLKKELTYIPLWGLYPKAMGQIPVDRGAGAAAMNSILRGCRRALATGRNIMIFPQGTRVKPAATAPYKPGIAKIYKDMQIPVVPMALNSGIFWGRNAFFKKSGTIVFEFLPPIPAGLPHTEMMAQLETTLETATAKLEAAARAQLS